MKPVYIVIAALILTLGFILFAAPEASVRATEVDKKFITDDNGEKYSVTNSGFFAKSTFAFWAKADRSLYSVRHNQ